MQINISGLLFLLKIFSQWISESGGPDPADSRDPAVPFSQMRRPSPFEPLFKSAIQMLPTVGNKQCQSP